MDRVSSLKKISQTDYEWDFIIIGGGATGVGTALEASSRGYKTLLLEKSDLGKGTSSRSTKLVHGGVRYLQQGNLSLVLEALKERAILLKNAPHLVHDMKFIVPVYDWWEGPFYGVGLKLYDFLAGKAGFGDSKILTREETIKHIPTVEPNGLRGGVIYHDGQFDDARLVINLAQTAFSQGASILNYFEVTSLIKSDGFVKGVIARDLETGKEFEIKSKLVINATGVFSDSIRRMDDPNVKNTIVGSQGTHIVLDREFLPGDSAIMVPHTDDGRVLFAIPWHKYILVGTTDTKVDKYSIEPIPKKEEIDFLLHHAAKYLTHDPEYSDIKSVFSGLRPLVKSMDTENTSELSRDHSILISRTGLLSIAGGKWTTYRRMAEDVINQAIVLAELDENPSVTSSMQIHGYHHFAKDFGKFEIYGSDAIELESLIAEDKLYSEKIHPNFETVVGQIIWAVREEMARTVDDFLSRRVRMLLFDARSACEMAPKVAKIMAVELGRNRKWVKSQVEEFNSICKHYIANQTENL